MNLTPWFEIGKDGPPVRSGVYLFELWLADGTPVSLYGIFCVGRNYIVTEDARFIGLCYEDSWRGVTEDAS